MTLEMHLFTVIGKMISKFDLDLNVAIDIFIKTVDLHALNYNPNDISSQIKVDLKIITFIINCQESRKCNEIEEDRYHATVLSMCTEEELNTINKQKNLIVETLKERYNNLKLQS